MEWFSRLNALTLIFATLCFFALGYRFYGLWLARKVLKLKESRITPAVQYEDGIDFVKTNKTVLFGYHFASISAAGPLLGPVLAVQFGFMPGVLWILIGSVLAGAVHDMIILFASVRHKAKGLAHIAESEISRFTGICVFLSVFFILILTLAVLSIAVVNAMNDSPWGCFTLFSTIPIAIFMGLCLKHWLKSSVHLVTAIGVALLLVSILLGPYVMDNQFLFFIFDIKRSTLLWIIPIYAFIASVLPIWLLLTPRDYLSSYLKVGTIVALALAIVIVRPQILMDPVTSFIHGGGPNISGPIFPFLFITIACGALSGFHAIIGTGTTPKLIANEKDILFVGYGAMLTEGFVAIIALIAAATLIPADYFAITAPASKFAALNIEAVDLPALSAAVRENLFDRPGGAVTLAVGMSNIFSSLPFMSGLTSYWYHFAIMFEAVFIITAVDTGTRVGRFYLQEALGRYFPIFRQKDWWPGIIITSFIFTFLWGYLVVTGDINTIWPLFGMSNQLLAACALLISTSMLIRLGQARYAWCTAVPGLFMVGICFWAGFIQVFQTFIPAGRVVLSVLGIIIMGLMLLVLGTTLRRWFVLLAIKVKIVDPFGDQVLALAEDVDNRG
ncbi:MAG: carbon starvation protein A [Deltaproteobacteria bacterium]|jgi:carbon starvation protein|nr:carbon starvation protein A [Deltaproteobacteria bacterium]